MAIITTNDRHYKEIASTIRRLAGTEATYTPEQMPAGLESIADTNYNNGRMDGYGEGYTYGFENGGANYRSLFWEQYQQGGERTDYSFSFAGPGWTEETFWPHHDMVVRNGYQMFAYCDFAGSLKQRLEDCRVQLRFEGEQVLMNLFSYADRITELGVMDFGAVPTSVNNIYIFSQCTALQTIEKLIVPVGQTDWTGWFSGCSALENIRIQGAIIHGGMNFSDSPKLTRESMLSVLNALADRSGNAGTAKITFGATNLAKLTDADKAIAAQKGWTLS